MKKINFAQIEKKWQKKWEEEKVFEVKEGKKKKFYVLEMYPYPSASGLHMGHALNYTIGDIFSRYKRMSGFNVLYPMGFDSFGLPAENAAIKAKSHPKKFTEDAIKNYIRQMKELGLSYDWNRMIESHKSEYYKWDQWIFLKMFEKGLAYKKKSSVNWCPKCNTVLANEQVHDGKCEYHKDTNVEIKPLEQWFLKTTAYADELNDFSKLNEWPELIKKLQKNWIGRSEGTEIDFEIDKKQTIQVESVNHFRENININSRLKIKDKEFGIKQIVKFRFDNGSYYTKLFLEGGYVLADDLEGNSFILVKEVKNGLKIKEDKIDFNKKTFNFLYTAHATAEETDGEEIFKKGEGETFWDYNSKDNSYLSLGIIDKTKKRLDFLGEVIYSNSVQILKEKEKWKIFTTRPDTLFGVTFLVVSAQHPKLMDLVAEKEKQSVEKFLKGIKGVSEKEMENTEKEGVFTGSYAKHPLTGEKIPVYAGNFVVADYGSGMVMAVPAHDERDFEFAQKYKIPIKVVIKPEAKEIEAVVMDRAYTGAGKLVNSGAFDDLFSEEAKEHITKALEEKKLGKKVVQFRLRDWLISRQRFWGTPIPIVYCDKCGIVPVKEKDLPVKLPENIKFTSERNPLIDNKEFVETKCPKCGGKGRRETDTMDTFVNSSWYYLRYCDSKNDKKLFDSKKVNYWCPIDKYIGGKEHATMHLIYIRFYTKFLRDLGLLDFDEPAVSLFNQGMLLGPDGDKMSKSKGNVVLPESVSKVYGIDTARLFLVSVASPDKDVAWSEQGVEGSLRFIKRIFDYFDSVKIGKSSKRMESKVNKAIKEITRNIEYFEYNLAVIKLRKLFEGLELEISKKDLESCLKLLSPFAPHIAEELWEKIGGKGFISLAEWPRADEKKIDEKFEKIDEMNEKIVSDVLNILKIVKEKQGREVDNVYVYVLPKELEFYDVELLNKRIGKKVEVYMVNDKNKHDLTGKSKNAKPGKPAIFVE